MLIAVVILGALLCIMVFVFLRSQKPAADSGASLLLKQDLTKLSQDISNLKDGLQHQLTDRMDKNQELMRETMHRQFSASSRLISEVTERLVKLDETNKRVVNVADELKVLQNVLQNPKQRGVLGEYYLAQVLENVMPPDRFRLQHKFKDGEIVDAIIELEKGKLLPIDSKFSLENYNRLVEEKDPVQRTVHAKSFRADLKNRIDETAKYIRPSEGTMDYAFMF